MMVPGMWPPGKAGVLLSIQHQRKDVEREQRRVEDQERVSISKASSGVGVSEHRDKGRPARSQAERDLAEEMKRGVSHINAEQTRREEQSWSCRQVSGEIKSKLSRARYQMNPSGSEQRS